MQSPAPKRSPVSRPVNILDAPRQWGYDARMDGYGRATCPFHAGTTSALEWIDGYDTAKREQYSKPLWDETK